MGVSHGFPRIARLDSGKEPFAPAADLPVGCPLSGVVLMPTVKELLVNGAKKPVEADAERSLLSVLRDDLGLTGAKYGCGEGECGACTVLLDGKPVRSCSTRVGTAEGKPIRTVEGLATGDKLHPRPGGVPRVRRPPVRLLHPGHDHVGRRAPGRATRSRPATEIVSGMNGNVCRCGTYTRIVAAVEKAAQAMKGGAK